MLALLKFKLDGATQKDFVQLPQLQVHRLFRVWDTLRSAPYTQHCCRRQCCFMYGGDNKVAHNSNIVARSKPEGPGNSERQKQNKRGTANQPGKDWVSAVRSDNEVGSKVYHSFNASLPGSVPFQSDGRN